MRAGSSAAAETDSRHPRFSRRVDDPPTKKKTLLVIHKANDGASFLTKKYVFDEDQQYGLFVLRMLEQISEKA